MTERELLRIHIEACWGIDVPPLTSATVELATNTALPPWSLYCAQLSQEEVTLWRPDVLPEQRARLLQNARNAGASFNAITGMRREVVLLEPATLPTLLASSTTLPAPSPHTSQAPETQRIVRILTSDDAARLDAFEVGSAAYYLGPQRAPCVGVFVGGQLVSVAHSSRRTTLACALGVDTLSDARRRGYATSATIAWTHAVHQERLLPIYSARADNTASLRLAAAAGYTPVFEGVYGPISETAL